MNNFVGEIILFAGNFAPKGWAFCDGRLLPVSQYTAVFSILGTLYGGNGTDTFALPDLRGRVPLGYGQGDGLSERVQGERSGVEQVSLLLTQIPRHSHAVRASASAISSNPSEALWAEASEVSAYGNSPTDMLNSRSIAPTGGSQPHPNVPPFQALNYIIALQGIYPQRP